MKYDSVNGQWPEGTNNGWSIKPTQEEAVRAVRHLYKRFTKRTFPYAIKVTGGRRWGGLARSSYVFYVNPEKGWHQIVHLVSHHAAFRLHPGAKAHDSKGRHAHIEREMIKYVVSHGWLEGKLRPPEKPPVDRKAQRVAGIHGRIKKWESKLKRAERALKKLRRQAKYYEAKEAA